MMIASAGACAYPRQIAACCHSTGHGRPNTWAVQHGSADMTFCSYFEPLVQSMKGSEFRIL